jgi:nucleoside-diphosphate-sugar epimerase
MKLLFVGGTGLLSSACSELAAGRGHRLFLLNRSSSTKYPLPDGATLLRGDVHGDPARLADLLSGQRFEAVVDFVAFTPEDIQRDIALFAGAADQFVFISSASAYRKPPSDYLITEDTPLENPFWQYSRDKIACEERLMQAYHTDGFPVTIVRPSLTYGPSQIPLCTGSWQHPWTIIERMKRGRPVIVPGDGTSLWSLTWNGDFAKGLLGLLGNRQAIGQAFHITSDEVLTWNQIYTEAAHALDVEPNLIHIPSELIAAYWPHATGSLIGDKANSAVFDNRKIKRFVPEFSCEVDWARGVRRAIDWHAARPEAQSLDTELERLWDDIITGYESAFPSRPARAWQRAPRP